MASEFVTSIAAVAAVTSVVSLVLPLLKNWWESFVERLSGKSSEIVITIKTTGADGEEKEITIQTKHGSQGISEEEIGEILRQAEGASDGK